MLWPSIGPLEIVRRCQNCIVIFAWIWRGGGQKWLTRKIPKSKDQESLDHQNLYESGLTFYQIEWRGLSSEYLSACTEKCIFQYFQASQLNPHRGGALGPSMKISCIGNILANLSTISIPRDSRDTRPYLHRVQDQPWSYNGPYRAPKRDLKMFKKF